MKLCEALAVRRHAIIAAVGAGGKTTTLQRLANELAAQGACVVSTTTTSIWEPQGLLALESDEARLLAATAALAHPGLTITVAAGRQPPSAATDASQQKKLSGVQPNTVLRLAQLAGVDYVLVEADGARGLSIKSPAAHEPVIPPAATHVLAITGIEALGEPLTGKIAHRPEQIAALLGIAQGTPLDARHIAVLLAHPLGGRKGVPQNAAFYPFINKVQDEASLLAARAIAMHLRALPGVTRVLIGAALGQEPVLEIW